jgi:hypothetical protein
MKTFMNNSLSGQMYHCFTLSDGTMIKSVLFNDTTENPARHYIKYYYNDCEILEKFLSYINTN